MSPTSIPGTVFSTSQDEFLDIYKATIGFLVIWKKGGQFTQILSGAERNLKIPGGCKQADEDPD